MFIEKNLKYYRKKAGLKQRELAEKTGCSLSSITKFESKAKSAKQSASLSTIAALAAVLNVRMIDIYEGRSFLLANPYDYIDDATVAHLNEKGYSRSNWDGGSADDFSYKQINSQLLMDLLGVEFKPTENGISITPPRAGETVYTPSGIGEPPEPDYDIPEEIEIPEQALEELLKDVKQHALEGYNEIVNAIIEDYANHQ